MEKCSRGPSLSDSGLFNDSYLLPYARVIQSRLARIRDVKQQVLGRSGRHLPDVADYHDVFGMHLSQDQTQWIMREWAPNATDVFILCDKSGWQPHRDFALEKIDHSVFEGRFSADTFSHKDLYHLKVVWPGGEGERIPTAARRVVQDETTLLFNAQIWQPSPSYAWRHPEISRSANPLLIYEAHIGMALEDLRVGTYAEFERHVLPKIQHSGYNTLQLMAIQEHPYYGSFGYHVSSFFAPSSRFGTPEELKHLIDTAHGMGIQVLMDMVHSHCVRNEVEGLSRFDGTLHQFFHDGPKGIHHLWDSRCFDYGKPQVIRFLLSNLKYWIDEFHVDGFRFDGITSMLFEDHGLGRAFTCYDDYYGNDVDVDALAYLSMANDLVHEIKPCAVSIAEDVSGYPGLAAPASLGGTGFDYRFAMGIADYWIKLIKEVRDEDWPMGTLWHELTTRRKEEKTISYAESHDQALVGDKTLMMHLMGVHIYTGMHRTCNMIETHRAVALHKMIRLITIATANAGYLNFMGNEFGHPEWVDFPSQQNGFSFQYARRQWSLKYHPDLYYACLFEFDRQMIDLVKTCSLFADTQARCLHLHDADKILAFERKGLIFVFNFHPTASYTDYRFKTAPGHYQMILNTDEDRFGGHERLMPDQIHITLHDPAAPDPAHWISLYLPARTAIVLAPRQLTRDVIDRTAPFL